MSVVIFWDLISSNMTLSLVLVENPKWTFTFSMELSKFKGMLHFALEVDASMTSLSVTLAFSKASS